MEQKRKEKPVDMGKDLFVFHVLSVRFSYYEILISHRRPLLVLSLSLSL
jgi:hypothetical protein